ncbi:hypothetical protein D3C72_1847660 [compost metagenome]
MLWEAVGPTKELVSGPKVPPVEMSLWPECWNSDKTANELVIIVRLCLASVILRKASKAVVLVSVIRLSPSLIKSSTLAAIMPLASRLIWCLLA